MLFFVFLINVCVVGLTIDNHRTPLSRILLFQTVYNRSAARGSERNYTHTCKQTQQGSMMAFLIELSEALQVSKGLYWMKLV